MASERMREHGVLFSAPMIRAILEGRKTQTRRAVKPRHDWCMDELDDGTPWPYYRDYVCEHEPVEVQAPHGPVGRRLWVRETWRARPSDYDPEGVVVEYRASNSRTFRCDDVPDDWEMPMDSQRWRPAIHMPRWASRIALEVTGVRVERVQRITEEDARAEGVDHKDAFVLFERNEDGSLWRSDMERTCRGAYACLWDEINGAGSWASNPWVWVYEFRRIGHGE